MAFFSLRGHSSPVAFNPDTPCSSVAHGQQLRALDLLESPEFLKLEPEYYVRLILRGGHHDFPQKTVIDSVATEKKNPKPNKHRNAMPISYSNRTRKASTLFTAAPPPS
jgi:hypothetical protein